ncbi:MAG: pseudouridine-5'-phosphate glycosidase [Pseudomonadota bacterium]|nr:pseudouridine-5'-phosphate glycosidase [Pseudomonadota bacterium]MEC8956144.1 pseudouridine-5'-phosphate glycosidase [Pseudomonadota bacterium]
MVNDVITPHLDINPNVKKAMDCRSPIIALESTIICHGMPYPKNVQTAIQAEQIARDNGVIPATIAIINGRLKVGLTENEIEYLGKLGNKVPKVSRRDLPFIISQKNNGATTVAATMIIAAMVKIKVFATGGIGGVHRDVNQSFDVSADLQELSQTSMAVVCSGIKSVLDIPKTLEYLETHGVSVIGFKTKNMPAFYNTDSGYSVDYTISDTKNIAETMKIKWDLQQKGGILITNPIPKEYSLPSSEINEVINAALSEMKEKNITGKETTPFLLSKIAEITEGKSLESNIQLVLNNVSLGSKIASCFNQLH